MNADTPTETRPPWSNSPECSPYLEYYNGHLQQLPLWPVAEAGLLLLPAGKLEIALHMADMEGESYGSMADRMSDSCKSIRAAVGVEEIEARQVEGKTFLVPSSFVAWAMGQGHRFPQEIEAIAALAGTTSPRCQDKPSIRKEPLTTFQQSIVDLLKRSDRPLTAKQITNELSAILNKTIDNRSTESNLSILKEKHVIANKKGRWILPHSRFLDCARLYLTSV